MKQSVPRWLSTDQPIIDAYLAWWTRFARA